MRKNSKKIIRKISKTYSNKRGSIFIESSIAFPLIIFSCVFIILLSVNYYIDLLYSVRADEKINKTLDSLTSVTQKKQTMKFLGSLDKKVLSKLIIKNNGSYLSQKSSHKYYLLSYFKNKHKNKNTTQKYIINEADMVRNFIP